MASKCVCAPRSAGCPDTSGLDERDLGILAELGREGDARVAFTGLKRRLGLHPEALSRALTRLERDGLVTADDTGYRLTDDAYLALEGCVTPRERTETLTVLQALLPAHASASDVATRLARRWFRGLRWYGEAGGPGERVLTWLTEDGRSRVRVRITAGSVVVEQEQPEDAAAAYDAAVRGVLAALADAYAPSSTDAAPARDRVPA